MNLKDKIKSELQVSLPIEGGDGSSIETAIRIPRNDEILYVRLEKIVIDCICKMDGYLWNMQQQSLITDDDGRKLDIITVERKPERSEAQKPELRAYYFDITDCMGKW